LKVPAKSQNLLFEPKKLFHLAKPKAHRAKTIITLGDNPGESNPTCYSTPKRVEHHSPRLRNVISQGISKYSNKDISRTPSAPQIYSTLNRVGDQRNPPWPWVATHGYCCIGPPGRRLKATYSTLLFLPFSTHFYITFNWFFSILLNKILTQMGTYKQILYHSIIGTKNREFTIPDGYCEELYRYIWGIVKNKNCTLYQINGSRDHLHLLTDLHPTLALANFIKDIKVASSKWMREHEKFPLWNSWGDGYGAFTCSYQDKKLITNYIKKQKEHHKSETFLDEYKRLLNENGIEFHERYLLG
jgi:putative transposase